MIKPSARALIFTTVFALGFLSSLFAQAQLDNLDYEDQVDAMRTSNPENKIHSLQPGVQTNEPSKDIIDWPPFLVPPEKWVDGPDLKNLILWSEFLSYESVESHLSELEGRNAALNIAVHADNPRYDALVHLCNEAARYGVQIRPWLLLSKTDLYWFNKWNIQASGDFVHSFLKEMRARGVNPSWLIFDIEPRQEVTDELIGSVTQEPDQPQNGIWDLVTLSDEFFAALDVLTKWSKKDSIYAATRFYNDLLTELHSQNVKVEVVTTNFVLHDLADHKRRAQSAFGLAIMEVPWDRVSIMLYRVEIQRILGKVTSNLVYQYAKRAHKYFGNRASVAVGEVGPVQYPHPMQGFTDPQDLHNDIAAAKAAGIDQIEIYSLDGMMDKGLDYWLTPTAVRNPKIRDWKVSIALTFLDFARGLLPKGQ
jgi:hypothetical protein